MLWLCKKIAYDVYGSCHDSWGTKSISNCKPGDILHYFASDTDQTWGHWVMVIAKSGNTLTFGECNRNGNCKISWGRTMSISSFSKVTCYSAPTELPVNDQSSVVDFGADFYGLIYNKANWRPIGQADNGNVEIMDEIRTNMDRLLWHFTKNSDGKSYRIQSLYNGKYLDVLGYSNGANVYCNQYLDSSSQQWCFIRKNGFDALKPVGSSSVEIVFNLNNGSTATGTNIQLWEWNGTNSQNFAPFYVTNHDLKLDYTITADKTEIGSNEKANISIDGKINCVYNYKFHVIDPEGNETIEDNKCNPTFAFKPSTEGKYIIFAEVKNTHYTEAGSKTNKSVTINVGCGHEYTEKFVEAGAGETQGYVLYTCTKCGNTYKDNYIDYRDGWYYADKLPIVITNDDYQIEYNNRYEKIQKDTPGEGWTKGETVKNEWVNSGGQYDSYSPLQTSDSRVLVKECYYHWCIPTAGKGTEGNYEQTDRFNHYDEIALPNNSIHVTWTGDDNGHTVYVLAWNDGNEVYCKSGEQCDGAWGSHDYRCRAWYKKYVYQNRVKNELYKYTKESGWTDTEDSSATNVSYRFKLKSAHVTSEPATEETQLTIETTESTAVTESTESSTSTNPTEDAAATINTSESTTFTEPSESSAKTDPTESTAITDSTDSTDVTNSTESTAATDATESTDITDPTESTVVTDPTESIPQKPTSESTEPSSTNPSESETTQPTTAKVEKTDISKWNVIGIFDETYTSGRITQDFVLVYKGKEYATFETSYLNNVNAGTATIVIRGTGKYTGTIVKTFKIKKAKQSLFAIGETKTVKYKKLKKAKQSVKNAIGVLGGRGTVTYSKVKSGSSSKLTISKSGTITVKKKTKKGTYKIKVKVTAKGNKNYKSASKTVTVKIKVR